MSMLKLGGDMNKKEKATAYHEAGHALAGYRFGHYGEILSIVPQDGIAGYLSSEVEWADGSKDVEQIIVLYAGYASESKYYPDANKFGSSGDDEKAAELLERTNETELNLRKKAKEIIDKNWIIIEAIAGKLFEYKTLEEEEWSIVIDAFDEGENWQESFDKMRAAIAIHNLKE
jgi:ATP-dependent Zn protease